MHEPQFNSLSFQHVPRCRSLLGFLTVKFKNASEFILSLRHKHRLWNKNCCLAFYHLTREICFFADTYCVRSLRISKLLSLMLCTFFWISVNWNSRIVLFRSSLVSKYLSYGHLNNEEDSSKQKKKEKKPVHQMWAPGNFLYIKAKFTYTPVVRK